MDWLGVAEPPPRPNKKLKKIDLVLGVARPPLRATVWPKGGRRHPLGPIGGGCPWEWPIHPQGLVGGGRSQPHCPWGWISHPIGPNQKNKKFEKI
jgi:hypothetical protein